ncbi:MAG: GGDEF domain-containing protein [Deltaproteobacteria bacterium]|nr:GGDEF domain-containing protein [Deltaproteobacteria bacterium]
MPEDKNFYKDLIDNLYDGVYFVDRDRVITYWNKGAERITGYATHRVLGHSCRDNLLNHVTAEGIPLCNDQCPLAACLEDGQVREAEVFLHHAEGHRLPVLARISPLHDAAGNIQGAVETFSDNSRAMAFRRQLGELRRTTHTDMLTGIANRPCLEGRLRAVTAEFEQRQGSVGLLFIDIDHFKQFNDTYGHDVGDKILRMVAATLRHNLRASDLVGRWGGEEFLALIYEVSSLEDLRAISEKQRTLVAFSSLDLEDQSLTVTISVGATLLLPHDTPESIVHRADTLMYQCKRAGRNRVCTG